MQPDELIEQFIASFEKLDEMAGFPEIHPLIRQLAVGSTDSYGGLRWRPMKMHTDASQLEPLRAKFLPDCLLSSSNSFCLTVGPRWICNPSDCSPIRRGRI